jgi:hypothetical protein
MPEAYSFNTDYIYWLPRMKRIINIVLVGKEPDKNILKLFTSVTLVGTVENQYAREKGTHIYLLSGALPAFTDLFYKKAEERIKNFEIF